MNPFDGDPNGPPPAPQWQGAYGGENDSVDDRDFADRENPRTVSRDDEFESAPVPVSRHRNTDYGTGNIQTAELPPPARLPPPSDALAAGSAASSDVPVSGRQRTLTTTRHTPAAEAAPARGRTVNHTVSSGEELSDIADQYGVREVEIIALNGMKPPYTLKSGQVLKIPARETGDAGTPTTGDYVRAGDRAVVPMPKPKLSERAAAEAPSANLTAPASSADPRFDWPVSGTVISGFGAGKDGLTNEGINIAVAEGTPVRAAASGTVRYAGNELRGYGNLVLIEHSGGYVTAYAHNEVLTVKRGQTIKRGEVIARSGQTGNVKSPQLHFEIRKGTQSLDPRKYLVASN
jgi:murein DD-endopeptidase MepM/ murein hydrolase activator NlpD